MLVIAAMASLVACGQKPTETTAPVETTTTNTTPIETDAVVTDPVETEPVVEMTEQQKMLDEVVLKYKPTFDTQSIVVDMTDHDMVKSFSGMENSDDIISVTAMEPMMNAQAFSVVLIEMAEGSDMEAAEAAVQAGIDPNKWVCVSADDVKTAVFNNYILVAMVNSENNLLADNYVNAFVEMMEKATTGEAADADANATEPSVETAPADAEPVADVTTEPAATETTENK